MAIEKNELALAGEYYVLAQLSARGYVATLTLGNAKGVDILVTNQAIDRLFRVEVKTTSLKPRTEALFSTVPAYHWTMSQKHEADATANLVFCFVQIEAVDALPRFFLVPSRDVATYVRWQHQHWLAAKGSTVRDTPMRRFRIPVDDPKGYQNNWAIFG